VNLLFDKVERVTAKVRFNKDAAEKALSREVEALRRDTSKSTTVLDDKYKNEVGRIKDTFQENDLDMKHEKRRTDKLKEGLADAKEQMELASAA